jgi:hypothetical protein
MFIGQDFGIGDSRVIVDRHVDDLPAGTASGRVANAGDAVARPPEAAQFLGIQVQQISRPTPLVARRRTRGLECPLGTQAAP